MNVGSVTTNNPIGYEYRKTQKADSVYKVKAWDTTGNVTEERMVDISKVDL